MAESPLSEKALIYERDCEFAAIIVLRKKFEKKIIRQIYI